MEKCGLIIHVAPLVREISTLFVSLSPMALPYQKDSFPDKSTLIVAFFPFFISIDPMRWTFFPEISILAFAPDAVRAVLWLPNSFPPMDAMYTLSTFVNFMLPFSAYAPPLLSTFLFPVTVLIISMVLPSPWTTSCFLTTRHSVVPLYIPHCFGGS